MTRYHKYFRRYRLEYQPSLNMSTLFSLLTVVHVLARVLAKIGRLMRKAYLVDASRSLPSSTSITIVLLRCLLLVLANDGNNTSVTFPCQEQIRDLLHKAQFPVQRTTSSVISSNGGSPCVKSLTACWICATSSRALRFPCWAITCMRRSSPNASP